VFQGKVWLYLFYSCHSTFIDFNMSFLIAYISRVRTRVILMSDQTRYVAQANT